jgi:glycosyltransferase involved in cell wall biosynthesis
VGLDATPLLGARTGVGQYVDHLVDAIAATPDAPDLTLTAFTLRGARALTAPQGHRVVQRPVPARLLQTLWARTAVPSVELLVGGCDVFHATNFVLPPTRRAVGVVTVHDLTFLRYAETVTAATLRYRTLVPRSVARAAMVLCPAEATAADVAAEYGLASERVVATPLGVSDDWRTAKPLAPEARHALGVPARYVLFVGSHEPRKRLPDLLAAHRAARAADDAVPPLVLAGPVGWGDQVDAPDAIDTGYLDEPTLRSLVAGATCLASPSTYEGFGLPVLEALACGTAVVASDLAVHREITGGHAMLVTVGDVDALAAALVAASRAEPDPEAVLRRKAWASTFTWSRCAEVTIDAYRRALAGARPG